MNLVLVVVIHANIVKNCSLIDMCVNVDIVKIAAKSFATAAITIVLEEEPDAFIEIVKNVEKVKNHHVGVHQISLVIKIIIVVVVKEGKGIIDLKLLNLK